ncbi:MAG: ABC transporter permease [Saccharofermentans sp.]|nr:ABC transporter permease [Mageeibacillus sp.]MCI1264842.1 ABC transporter permease [Saccharofermentans sp.]MCI1275693.1 ABC transporter permease [Saccharofermentans sp.]MCI1769898.1 ABC transporter permease [Mageeibacillus sp.]
MRFLRRFVPNLYIVLVLAFIYLPILILIVYSFNALPKSFIWGGFTLDNYKNLFSGSDGSGILDSLLMTLKVAAIASVTSTLFAVLSALGIAYLSRKMQGIVMGLTYVPNVMPDLVTGISFMLLFSFLGVQKSEFTLIMAHIALCVPFAILSITPKIRQLDKSLSEAAMDLGATRGQTLRLVIIPEIMPGILSSLMLTFTLSVDDYLISNFNVDSSIQTLPMMIYSMAKLGVNPKMNALTTLLFCAVLILMILSNLSSIKKNKKQGVKL